jgi:hypothetical protein
MVTGRGSWPNGMANNSYSICSDLRLTSFEDAIPGFVADLEYSIQKTKLVFAS